MGTTFIGLQDNGFWMRDSILELWLRFAALHIKDTNEDQSLAHTIRNEWLLASRGIFSGSVPFHLEANISTPEGKAIVLAACNSWRAALRTSPPMLDRNVINVMGMTGEFLGDVETWRLIEVSEAILDLIDGKRFGGSADTSFMPGSGGPRIHPLSFLEGRQIVAWIGDEMALSGGEPCIQIDAAGREYEGLSEVRWEHPDVPYLQFTGIDLQLADETVVRLMSQLDDSNGIHGLVVVEQRRAALREAIPFAQESTFRTRTLHELPTGVARVVAVRDDGRDAVIEATIVIADHAIRVLAGEVHESDGGELWIAEQDESVLLQLNGARPR